MDEADEECDKYKTTIQDMTDEKEELVKEIAQLKQGTGYFFRQSVEPCASCSRDGGVLHVCGPLVYWAGWDGERENKPFFCCGSPN